MATKNISITEEAYRRLAALRKKNESFSEIIIEITHSKKAKLRDFHGIISKKAAETLEKSIEESRKINRILHEKRIERLKKEIA